MILEFKMRRSYGHNRYYPANAAAEVIVKIAARVCILDEEIAMLKVAGYDVRFKPAGD